MCFATDLLNSILNSMKFKNARAELAFFFFFFYNDQKKVTEHKGHL